MGNTSSTQNLVVNETNLKMTQTYVNNNIISATQNSTNKQALSIQFGYNEGCSVDVSQTINATQHLKSSIDNTVTVEFKNQLTQSLDSAVKANSETVSGFASLSGGNASDVTNTIMNTVNEVLNQQLTNNNILITAQNAYNEQTGVVVYAYCKNAPIVWNQSIVSNVISNNILTNIQTALMQNSLISSVVSHADLSASTHSQGLNDVIDSIGKAIASIFGAVTMPCIIGAVLCAICCIVLLFFMLSPAGQQATVIGAQAGANASGKVA